MLASFSLSYAQGAADQKRDGSEAEQVAVRTETPADRNNVNPSQKRTSAARSVVRVGPSTTYLKPGLSAREVLVFMGKPASIDERQDGETLRTVYVYTRSGGKVFLAEFVDGLLVGSRTETQGNYEQAVLAAAR